MAATLQAIAQQLIGSVSSAGLLTLDNSIIASDCFASLLGVLGSTATPVTQIPVQVGAQSPGQNIYVQQDVLYVTGTAQLYGSAVSSFEVQVVGQNEPTRTATLTGTLATLTLNQLGALGLVNSTDADAYLPDATLTNLALQAQAGTRTPQLTLTVASSTASWSVLPEPLTLSLTNLRISLLRPAAGQSSGPSVSASVTGDFDLGSSGVKASLVVTLLMTTPEPANALVMNWTIGLGAGSGSGTIGLSDTSLAGLLGGVNALGLLPASLVQQVQGVTDFGLKELAINFDPTAATPQKVVQSIVVGLGSSHSWPLVVSSFLLDELQVTVTVSNPLLATRTATAVLGGTLELGSPANTLTATMQLPVLPASGNDWLLQATGEAQLSSFSALGLLPGSTTLTGVALPGSLSSAQIKLTSFEVAYNSDPAANALAFLSLAAQLQDSWPVLGSQVVLANPTLTVYVPGASLAAPPPLTVSATAQLLLPTGGMPSQVPLALSASYVAGTGWTFTGTQAPGTALPVIKVAAYLLGITLWPDDSLNLAALTVSNLAATVTWSSTGAATTYTFRGQTSTWAPQLGSLIFSLQATLALHYDGTTVSGSVSVPISLAGLSFVVSYELQDDKKQLTLTWQGFTFLYDDSTDTITATTAGSDWSIGSLLTALVNEITPGNFSLPSPWDLLNSVSLNGLDVCINLSTKVLTVSCDLDVKLFFIEIDKLELTVQQGRVSVNLTAKFLGQPSQPLQWNAAQEDPPAVPGSGSDLFNLRFAAFGQHVAVNNLPLPDTLGDFFGRDDKGIYTYLQYFAPPDQNSGVVPVQPGSGTTPALAFSEASHWLLAADFTVAKFYTLQVVFADPVLYGLRIAIADGAAYFKNLDFEILYKKISDTIGVYQVDLQLPDQFRQLQFGEVSVTLPVIGIKVYTNGNFYLDFGFPASLTDFSRSFSVQVFPFTGYGGFYFGYLSGATSTSVPTTTLGQFNPVIEAGLGLSLGVGKTINEGILSAGLSLTAVGIFQGVLGFFTRYEAYDGRTTDTYYRFDATVALVGRVYGSVNFAIISAQFDITAYVSVALTIEAYQPIPITFSAGVSVSLTVKINLGLFKVSISLHFSTTISASFSIGSDTSSQALWNVGQPKLGDQRWAEMLVLPTPPVTLLWQPLLLGTAAPQALTAYFVPHLTVSAATQAAYVAMLYIDAPAPGATGPDTSSLGTLACGVLAWALNALLNSSSTSTTYAALLTRTVTAEDVQQLLHVFESQPNSMPPFSYSGAAGQDVQSFLSAFFSLNILAPDTQEVNGAVLPPLPELTLQTSLGGTVTVITDFAQQNEAGTNYVTAVTELLQSLSVSYETSLAARPPEGVLAQVSQSLPAFFFADYVALLAKNMLQSSLAYLNDTSMMVETVQDLLLAVRKVDVIGKLAGMASRFLLHGLRLPAPAAGDTLGTVAPLYVLTGQQFNLPPLQAGANYQVQLSKAAITSWLTFGSSATDLVLPVLISDDEVTRIGDITQAAGQLAPVLTTNPAPLPNYADKPQLFTLGNPVLWQYPGTYFDGVSGFPTLLKLPATLLAELATGNAPSDFTVWALDRQARIPVPVAVQHYCWATSVVITVQRLTTSGPASPLQASTYSLVGADDMGVAFLQYLVEYLHAPGSPLTGTVQLLYQPAPTTNTRGGLVSAPNNGTGSQQVSMAIVQANLSTETNPAVGSEKFALTSEELPPSNTLNTFTDFVTLLWECSIVRSGGYYLYYKDVATGGLGLPDTLFDAHGSAQVQLLFTFPSFVPQPFLNCLVVGDQLQYASNQVYAQSPSLLVRSATLLPGTVGYSFQRQTPGEYDPVSQPPTLQDDGVYLENQFNLVGATLAGLPAYQNLLPVGPVDEYDPATEPPSGTSPTWPYQRVIPYYQFVQQGAGLYGFADPYAGVGNTASITLNWQDLFGNELPMAAGVATVSTPVLYTDPLLAVSQWPSTTATYEFAGTAAQPQLTLTFTFSPNHYQSASAQSAQNNAAVDLQTWMRLWFQLQHLADLTASFVVSLDGTQQTPLGTERTLDLAALRTQFVRPVIDYLYAIATPGAPPVTAPLAYVVTSAIDPASISTYADIFPLTVSLTLSRTNHVDPSFSGVPGVQSATTTLAPQSLTMLALATQFESVFNASPTSGVQLKLATSANLNGASTSPGTAPLWVGRFDPSGQQGLSLTYKQNTSGQPLSVFCAPPPLATTLQSLQTKVYPYTTGSGTLGLTGTNASFTGVNLDSWAQQLLAAIDKLLTPTYAVPVFLLDNGSSLGQLLGFKKQLAGAIAQSVTNIIASDDAPDDGVGNAREKWRQQLLIQLSAAYTYTAAVQTPVQVTSLWSGPNTDPPMASSPPRLYGQMVGTAPIGAATQQPQAFEQAFSLSAAKLPIGSGQSWLTYLFQCKEVNGQQKSSLQSFPFGNMEFAISHLEWQYEAIDGVNGYLGSSWLNLLLPATLPISYTQVGQGTDAEPASVTIPIPLRAYPTPPSVTQQVFISPSVTNTSANLVMKARSWDFQFTYQISGASQDTIALQVQFNAAPQSAAAAPQSASPYDLPQLAAALAQFIGVYPAVSADLDQYLVPQGTAANAQAAVQVFLSLVESAANAWQTHFETQRRQKLLKDRQLQTVVLNFQVEESAADPADPTSQLVVTVIAATANPAGYSLLTIEIPGYISTEISAGVYSYKCGDTYLSFAERGTVTTRQPTLAGVDILNQQNGWAGLQIIRNQDLLPATTGTGWQTTNPAFIYQTPLVMANSPLTPLFSVSSSINIAQLPAAGVGPRSLSDNIAALAASLTQNLSGSLSSLPVKVACEYQYPLATGPLVTLPVTMTIMELSTDSTDQQQQFAAPLSQVLNTWLDSVNPTSPTGAQWSFNVSIFSAYGSGPPILHLAFNLTLADYIQA